MQDFSEDETLNESLLTAMNHSKIDFKLGISDTSSSNIDKEHDTLIKQITTKKFLSPSSSNPRSKKSKRLVPNSSWSSQGSHSYHTNSQKTPDFELE